ncbi:hypothetical protein IFM89_017106 [Coptis chinensis]|uniref:C2H2-type domain-containing protein n=1 Tax=Coptis chinensis TaxID=261450 RepID=A0A835HN97_9MAGN|nr:hypothetical protein IFM89_017106 [Coptis chinensis]
MLSACLRVICLHHACLIEDGWKHFDSMVHNYDTIPEVVHYACMVDLLGRRGLLDKAAKFIDSMPIEPDASVWRALFGACHVYSEAKLAKTVFSNRFFTWSLNTVDRLMQLESPCEHAFCLDCARSDSSCYICDERIQKIQTIKMMEGIFICAAPHCLKSFLKKSEFETHIHETHADLLQSNIEKEDGNESDTFNMPRPSSMDFTMSRASSIDAHAKQSIAADSSTARTPARTAFSPNSNSQPHDLDDRTRPSQPRDQPPQKSPIIQPKQPPFYARPPNYPLDLQSENIPSPVFDRAGPYNRFHNQQNFDMQAGPHQRRDSDQNPDKQQGIISELPSSEYLQHPLQQPNFVVPVNTNQRLAPPAYNFSPFPAEGAHMFYNARYEAMRPDMPSESGREQGSLLGFPPAPTGDVTSSDSYPRPWNMGAVMPFEQMPAGQGMSESYANQLDAQGRATLFQGDYGQVPGVIPPTPMGNMGSEPLQGSSSSDNRDGKGVLAPQPRPPPPPPPPRHLSQFTRGNFPHPGDAASQEGLSYGWQHEKHDGYGGSQD